ncbi:MAG: energy transducer TonB [Salinivirgaceae bacterium]|nr:energy transducer TonB [Salinivirgaceae bacterium]
METKKSKKADLKNKSGLFFQVGIITALGIVFAAFQWSVEEKMNLPVLTSNLNATIEEVFAPITRPEVEEQKKKEAHVVEVITIVDDDIEIEVELEIEATDRDIPVTFIANRVEEIEEEVIPFYKVEQKPEFIGGESALIRFLAKETNYPQIAIDNGSQGRVHVSFVIDEQGKVTEVALLRGVDPLLDKEALRVVKSMPNWKPGKQRNKAIKVRYQVPINFRLN